MAPELGASDYTRHRGAIVYWLCSVKMAGWSPGAETVNAIEPGFGEDWTIASPRPS